MKVIARKESDSFFSHSSKQALKIEQALLGLVALACLPSSAAYHSGPLGPCAKLEGGGERAVRAEFGCDRE